MAGRWAVPVRYGREVSVVWYVVIVAVLLGLAVLVFGAWPVLRGLRPLVLAAQDSQQRAGEVRGLAPRVQALNGELTAVQVRLVRVQEHLAAVARNRARPR